MSKWPLSASGDRGRKTYYYEYRMKEDTFAR